MYEAGGTQPPDIGLGGARNVAALPGKAVRKAVDEGQLLVSDATLDELAEVLSPGGPGDGHT